MNIVFGDRTCILCEEEISNSKPITTIYCSRYCANKSRGEKYRKLNKEKIKLKNKIDNSWAERRIYSRVKSRAKINKIPFNLDLEDIIIPEFCPVLGIKLNLNHGVRGYHPDSASLDKIDPKLGYVKGNIRVISGRANLLKSDASIEELDKVLSDLRRLKLILSSEI